MTEHDATEVATELAGLVVIELGSDISGAFAARILGDFGAEVTKIEPPGGDPLRGAGAATTSESALFEYLAWNKGSAVLDLTAGHGRAALVERLGRADVVITSLSPAEARRLGVEPAAIRAWAPHAVVVSVTDFGSAGPFSDWRATDLVLQAMGGVMAISGRVDREPLRRGLRQSHYYAGLNAAYAATAGVFAARTSGEGVLVDLARRECVSAELVMNQALYAFLGLLQSRPPALADPFGGYPLETADGFVALQASSAAPMNRLADLFDDDRLNRPAYASKEGRTAHATEIQDVISPRLTSTSARQLFLDAAGQGCIAGFVQSASEMLSCDQLRARSGLGVVPGLHGSDGPLVLPSSFARFSGWGVSASGRGAPAVGEDRYAGSARAHREPVLGEGFSSLRVLDLSQVFAGPYLGGLLADFGADVVKIESPHRLDQARTDYGGYFDNVPGEDPWNRTSTFQVINRGKRSISLDLKSERGRQLFLDLVADADVVIENFTPRVMRSLGLDYDTLRSINPRLVMLSNSGFGATGPWAEFKAQGTTLEATMGVCTYTGYAGGPPSKAGQSYPDFIAAWTGLTALLAALVGRLDTGRGQWLDLGMYELGAAVMPEAVIDVQLEGCEISRTGNLERGALVSGVVPTGEPGGWLAISIDSAQGMAAVRGLVDAPKEADADEVLEAVRSWARDRGRLEAAEALQEIGVAAGPVLDARDLLLDQQLAERGFYEHVDVPGHGEAPIIGRPFRWEGGGVHVGVRGRAPRFAEHSHEVLGTLPHADAETMSADIAGGAVALGPRNPAPASANDYTQMIALGSVVSVGGDYRRIVDEARRVRRPGDTTSSEPPRRAAG
ncbi:putative Formyl-CoA transferase [metagenome]|uniref:Putative Formyl-CoA transferase n=1 Tax=metagenome TaxID=256318 RepID=A0A2P2C933_9ZZZZ